MIKLIFYISKINFRNASIGEYLSVFIFPVFLSFLEKQEFSPLVILLLINKYCNQFKNMIDPFFVKLTGIYNSTFLLTSNVLIIFYTFIFYGLAQILICIIEIKLFDLHNLYYFLTLNFLSIILGNLISVLKRFNDFSNIINAVLNLSHFVLLFVIWVSFIVINDFFYPLIVNISFWVFQLLIFHKYDRNKKYI
jgi:hypothetical protein